jgi:4-hydroxybenzoate polyprenyltransferase
VLATGAAGRTARAIAAHLDLFDEVVHSTVERNLTSRQKRDLLVERFGEAGFDYVGNSRDDLAVFDAAREAVIVSPDRAALAWHRANGGRLIKGAERNWKTVLKAIRVHQWLKNVLILVPVVLNQEYASLQVIGAAILAFFSFSFAASAVYVLNDLTDLRNDRKHTTKRARPLASGALSIPNGVAIGAALASASLILALMLPPAFLGVLVFYAAATTTYSFVLKRKLLVDVFTLASLYTLRIVAGAMATGTEFSFWLLAFSIFFFLSLALVKRYVELDELVQAEGERRDKKGVGRGYYAIDFEMVGQAGIASAFSAALVLALYVHSEEVALMYPTPWLLWPLCPLILYMLLRIWMLARRGQMHDDPVVFIMRDWRSQLIMCFGAVLVIVANLVAL